MNETKCPFLLSFAPIRERLIGDWKLFFKFWSVKIDLISLAISTYGLTFPDMVIKAWNSFPQQLKDMLPPQYLPYISVALLILSMVARSIKQPNLKAKNESECISEDKPHDIA